MSSIDEQRSWLAMQYVLGELSEAERIAFEVRLPDDEALCEAVTLASRIALTARASLDSNLESLMVPVEVAGSSRSGRIRTTPEPSIRGSWVAVAASLAAMILLVLSALKLPVGSPNGTTITRRDPAAAELVSIWRSGMNVGETDVDDANDLADISADVAVPGWMLAAVSFEAGAVDGPSEKSQEN